MKVYITISGDEWDVICHKVYGPGGEMYMDKPMNSNPEHLDTVVFSANVELEIPEIENEQNANNLPPWMR